MKKILIAALIIASLNSKKLISNNNVIESAPYYSAFFCGFNKRMNDKRSSIPLKSLAAYALTNTVYQNTLTPLFGNSSEQKNKRSIKRFFKKNIADTVSIGKHYVAGYSFGFFTMYIMKKMNLK